MENIRRLLCSIIINQQRSDLNTLPQFIVCMLLVNERAVRTRPRLTVCVKSLEDEDLVRALLVLEVPPMLFIWPHGKRLPRLVKELVGPRD
jgi:hypothetical protein